MADQNPSRAICCYVRPARAAAAGARNVVPLALGRFAPDVLTWENYTDVILGWRWAMTLGLVEQQGELFNVAVQRCEADLPERSIYRLLHAEWDRLFGDDRPGSGAGGRVAGRGDRPGYRGDRRWPLRHRSGWHRIG
jgi:hypothetical protein